jgi:cyclin H
MTYHPKKIMATALFVATKTDNYYMSLRSFAEAIPGNPSTDEVVAPEFLLMQGLRFTFDVRHPFRGLEGGVMELSAIAQGQGQPTPLLPHQTAESLKQGILSIAPPPTPSSSITDRIGRAHNATRELLKTAAQMTDVYFLYTPSQIWLSALLLSDRPLAEYYLETKLGGPITSTPTNPDPSNPLDEIRTKLFKVLSDCAALLQAYTPLSADAAQIKNLKRIAKKHYKCQNPDGANMAQKRDSAPPRAVSSAAATDSGQVTSESETERLAKKRKLEEQKQNGPKDMFGGELVPDRTKGQ